MKKGITISITIAVLYCGVESYLLETAISHFNPQAWGAGFLFDWVESFTVWGAWWMQLIGGPAYLANTSPWAYLVPIIINSIIIFLIGLFITKILTPKSSRRTRGDA